MAYNPENKISEMLEIDQAYEKACETLKQSAIDPDDFKGKYGYNDNKIEIDKNWTKKLEKGFRELNTPEGIKNQKFATIFEAIIHENSELSDWFGPDASTVKTSDFDDFENGVDTVVEFTNEEEIAAHLALAIDVTFSSDTHEKFNRIKNEIEKGKLAHIEYFVSENSPHRRLEKIPRVVIGADAKTVDELREIWAEGEKKKLGEHPIQFQILQEIIIQLKTFSAYAEEIGDNQIVSTYNKELSLVQKIYDEKIKSIKDPGERDNIFYAMEEGLKRLFRTPK